MSDFGYGGRSSGGTTSASNVTVAPVGDIAATTLQGALEEIDDEKSPLGHAHANLTPKSALIVPASGATQLLNVSGRSDARVTLSADCVISTTGWDEPHDVLLELVQPAIGGPFDVEIEDVDWGGRTFRVNPVGKTLVWLRKVADADPVEGRWAPRVIPQLVFNFAGEAAVTTEGPPWEFDDSGEILGFRFNAGTAPTGGTSGWEVNLLLNGVSIFPNAAARVRVPVGTTRSGLVTGHTTSLFDADDVLEVRTTAVGSTEEGRNGVLRVYFLPAGM